MGERAAAAAKTSVWWDIDRCAVPPGGCDPHRIAHNVITALAVAGYTGPVSIVAYGDASRIAPSVLEALSATGISLNHVPAGAKDGVDKKMLVDMLFWAFDNPPPGNYLLISGDQDFSGLLHRLRMKQYGILLAQPPNASSQTLANAAKTVWLWESFAAGEPLLAESLHSRSMPDSNQNLNNSDASKCSQSKVRYEDSKGDGNVKAGNQYQVKPLQKYVQKTNIASSPAGNQYQVKPLQKYVQKTNITSSPAGNQDRVELVDGASDSSIGSTASELGRSSVSSSSSSSESMEGTKVDQSSLLGTPTMSQTSAQKPMVFTHSHQVGTSHNFIIGEKPSTSTECASRNGTLDFGVSNGHYHQMYQQSQSLEAQKLHSEHNMGDTNGKVGNERKVKPLRKYVKKTTIASRSASNQVDSVGVYDCSIGSTKSGLDLSSVLPSNSESLEGAMVDSASPLGTSTFSQSSKPVVSTHLHQVRAPHQYIIGKKPSTSTEHASRVGTCDLGVDIGHYHPTYQQQSQSSEAQNKLHFNCNMGDINEKAGNQYKVKQHQEYVNKINISSSSASSEIDLVNGFPDNSKGSILGHPSQFMSSTSLEGAKVNRSNPIKNPPFSLSSAQKPVTPTHLHQVGAEFIFGKKPSTSIECMPKNGIFNFGASSGHYNPSYQQTQSSLLPKQHNSGPPHPHSEFGQSYSINSGIGSSHPPSAGNNGVPSSQIQTWPSGSTFQGPPDICPDISNLTISECSRGTGETRPPFQDAPANYPVVSTPNISRHPRGLHEIRYSFHPGPNVSFHPNHSSAPQSVQPPSSDYTCKPPDPPNLSCNMQNPGNHGEKQGSPPNSSEPEGTIRNIVRALDILKTEKIFPTESNIADCMRYGEMNLLGFDVKKALELAIRHQAVIMKKLVDDMPLFVAKDERLWKCVDVRNSNAKHPKETLDTVRKYISSTSGHSAIKNSQSRYQAATILKNLCLQHHALGDVLQILHIVIVRKKWLVPHSSGWQPLSFNTVVADATTDAIGEARS